MANEKEKFDTEKIVNEIIEQGEIFNDIEEDLLHELIGNKISTITPSLIKRLLLLGIGWRIK